ncbi:MAG: polymer-forming cytoskeletal protein [Clostridiales bacterium]|jgi:cytoskeletal protein CcmA (bactofilin family)|nr:polymer-forming cytoskeletal protein [Clostridiales bacterium]
MNDIRIIGEGIISEGQYDDVSIVGNGRITGQIKCNNLKITGDCISDSGIISSKAKVLGNLATKSELKCDNLKIKGCARIGANCDADRAKIRGKFDVNGFLNSGEIEFRGKCFSKVKELGGGKILAKKPRFSGPFRKKLVLYCDSMEFDDIDVSYTEAKLVRGKNVQIGRGSKIEKVEYYDSFTAHPKAQIGEVVKV